LTIFVLQMANVTNILIVVLSVCCALVACHNEMELIIQLQEQVARLERGQQNITSSLGRIYSKIEGLQTALFSRVGKLRSDHNNNK